MLLCLAGVECRNERFIGGVSFAV